MNTRPVRTVSGPHSDFDDVVEAYRKALVLFLNGDPKPPPNFFSRRDDVTLANPLGPPRRGPADVGKAIREAAGQLSDGAIHGFEEVSRYRTADLGCIVYIERTEARLAGRENPTPIALRVTMIFRREGDAWKVVHRHADPITTSGSITPVFET